MPSTRNTHPRPEEVFTPRASEINTLMYVSRPTLERRLMEGLRGNKFIVVHGESGNGKTWLYKRVFAQQGVYVQVLNLANVITLGSFPAAFEAKLGELGHEVVQTKGVEISTGIRPMGVGADVKNSTIKSPMGINPFVALLTVIRDRAGDRDAALVLDNFEAITDNENALKALASIIVSADEDAVGRLGVKVLIVGVPGDIRTLIARAGNAATISNRLTEIPEVARMTVSEARTLMHQGLEGQLGLEIEGGDADALYEKLCFLTDRIAQQIHEICLKLAYESIDAGGIITEQTLRAAEISWADDTLSADWAVIQSHMNVKGSAAGRKNQLLYALGRHDLEDFRYTDIEPILREEFPDSTRGVGLNVAGMLTTFSSATNPILRRTPNQDAYRFVSPKLRMALRTRLQKTSSQGVVKTF